jgi:predicted outer membrane repeat protein
MGTLQMLICTVAFALLGLPPGDAFFSQASAVEGGGGVHAQASLPCLIV